MSERRPTPTDPTGAIAELQGLWQELETLAAEARAEHAAGLTRPLDDTLAAPEAPCTSPT